MRTKPLCSKCGEQHWFFIHCDDAPARNAADEEKARYRPVHIERPIEPVGVRPDGRTAVDWSTPTTAGSWWKDNQ